MSVIWKDGQFFDGLTPQIFHDDSGLSGGLGVFDSMLAVDGILIDALEHFERLVHDAEIVLGMGQAWMPGFAAMTEIWQPLLSENHLTQGHARLRTMITGGISPGPLLIAKVPSLIVTVARTTPPEEAPPVSCAVVSDFPRIAGCVLENCKRLDYSRSFAARRAAMAAGAEDAILTNTDGNIACGATSNLFIREGSRLITPPLRDGILAGITRRKILEDGKAVEDSISENRLRAADEIFLANSFVGMRKVSALL